MTHADSATTDDTAPEPAAAHARPPHKHGVTDAEESAAAAPAGPVSKWAIHRRLYDWVVGFAHKPYGTWALGTISFAESSFFPIPPDVLLAPMCLGDRRKAWWFAAVTTVTSVLGAVAGYLIGAYGWDALGDATFRYVPGFTPEKFDHVQHWYDEWGVWVLFAAAFTPIPFKVFTIAGGVFAQALLPFILASAVGRGARFFLVAGLFWWVGPKATPLIDKYFNWVCLAFVVLLVGGVLVLKVL